MTNYAELVELPDYRNLAVNPGCENAYAASWLASNGQVLVGESVVPPKSGSGHLTYRVTASTTKPYYFGPLGPDNNTVHYGMFKIGPSRTVSARVSVRSDQTVWVRMLARYLVETREAGSEQTTLVEFDVRPLSAGISVAPGGWVTVNGAPAAAVPGATHWQPVIAVFSSDPATTALPPDVDTVVYADEMFVTENGVTLSGVPYVDGSVSGAYWEGEPNYSTSRTGTVDAGEEASVESTESTEDDLDDALEEVPADEPTDEIEPDPVEPVARATDQGNPLDVQARYTFRYRRSPSELSMRSDIQLSELVMNTVDDQGVVWIVSDIEGWWTIPEVDVPDQPKAWFDGSYETRGRYAARVLTLSGSFIPRSIDDVDRARDRLIRAANLCHSGGWLLTHQDPSSARTDTRGSKVWLSGAPQISTVAANGRTDFSIGLRAPDPIKYGIRNGVPPGYESITLITSRSEYPERAYPRTYPWAYPEAVFGLTDAQAVNRGNSVVFPVLRMRGPTNGPVRILNIDTEQTFRIIRKLYPGEELVVDCASRQVTLNGVGNYRFYLDIDVDWLMFQPGPNRLRVVEEELGGERTELEVQWRSGWIG